jgi:hypothetical protein
MGHAAIAAYLLWIGLASSIPLSFERRIGSMPLGLR